MNLAQLIGMAELVQPLVLQRARRPLYRFKSWNEVDFIGVKTKMIIADIVSPEERHYKVCLQISKVQGPIREGNPCTVRCTCPSFRHWFATADHTHGALFGGKFPKYIPVPEEQLRYPPRRAPWNPSQIPGMCKHVVMVVNELQRRGIIDFVQ